MKGTSDLRGKKLLEALVTVLNSAASPRAILYRVKGTLFAASLLKLAVEVLHLRALYLQ